MILIYSLVNRMFAKLKRWISNTFTADWASLSNQITLLLSLVEEVSVSVYDKEIEQLPITGIYQFPSDSASRFMYVKDGYAYFYTPSESYKLAPDVNTVSTFISGKITTTNDFVSWKNINISKTYGIDHKSVYLNGYIYIDFYKVPFGTVWNPISKRSYSYDSTASFMATISSQVDSNSPYGDIIDIATDDTNIYRISTLSNDFGDGAKTKGLYVGNALVQKPISYMLPEKPMDLMAHSKYFYGHPTPYNLNGVSDFTSVRACGIVYNSVLFVQIYNLLYKLTSTNEIDKIYKLSFPVTDMFVINNYIHIITDRSIIKCNL